MIKIFDIILDPNIKGGCTVWTGNKVSTIKGCIQEVCDEIHRRTMVPVETPNGYKLIQVKTIGIDVGGYGRAIADMLVAIGISYTEIHSINIDSALPKLR